MSCCSPFLFFRCVSTEILYIRWRLSRKCMTFRVCVCGGGGAPPTSPPPPHPHPLSPHILILICKTTLLLSYVRLCHYLPTHGKHHQYKAVILYTFIWSAIIIYMQDHSSHWGPVDKIRSTRVCPKLDILHLIPSSLYHRESLSTYATSNIRSLSRCTP